MVYKCILLFSLVIYCNSSTINKRDIVNNNLSLDKNVNLLPDLTLVGIDERKNELNIRINNLEDEIKSELKVLADLDKFAVLVALNDLLEQLEMLKIELTGTDTEIELQNINDALLFISAKYELEKTAIKPKLSTSNLSGTTKPTTLTAVTDRPTDVTGQTDNSHQTVSTISAATNVTTEPTIVTNDKGLESYCDSSRQCNDTNTVCVNHSCYCAPNSYYNSDRATCEYSSCNPDNISPHFIDCSSTHDLWRHCESGLCVCDTGYAESADNGRRCESP